MANSWTTPQRRSWSSLLWWSLWTTIGCVRAPDPGGQEGEERWPGADSEQPAEGEDSGSDTGAGGEDPGVVEGDWGGFSSVSGTRTHLRGIGAPGDYSCALVWQVDGVPVDSWCADCAFVFDIDYVLDTTASARDADACEEVYTDHSTSVGLMHDYNGYGPMVVGQNPYTGEPYPLGAATVGVDQLTWSYGYADELLDATYGTYGTWLWQVEVAFE